jgi:hypothetical protein
LGLSAAAWAGGGPENVLLVVNRKSAASLTIANYYAQLRQIPAGNILTLPWDPKAQTTDVETFRKKILAPVLQTIDQRRLSAQIDYVVYSSDFPTAISLDQDIAKAPNAKTWPPVLGTVGSLTGLTFLWQAVQEANPAYIDLGSNWYTRAGTPAQKDFPTLTFMSRMNFGPQGEVLPPGKEGRRYLLSVMLGVTAGRGNSLAEVLAYLKRSAAADGTQPRGTIYYMRSGDKLRSGVREPVFAVAVKELKALGVNAEILDGVLPPQKKDVQGAMIGYADFQWKSSGSTILPGAICEHFTSFGGIMTAGAGQTPLTEFLRYGAAGASGTVTEPYSIQPKFPLALIQVHYARGCTLAEAFYQSVMGPYQLLIVGDPLCRPWANIPQVTVAGVEPRETVKGKLSLRPVGVIAGNTAVEHFELFVDDLRMGACVKGGTLELDTAQLADGFHELRIVAVEAGLIRSQGRALVPVTFANHGRSIEASVAPQGTAPAGSPLVVSVKSPGSTRIAVLHNSHLVGTIAGESGRVEIDPAVLGSGPVRLRAVGIVADDAPIQYVWSPPLEVHVGGR